MTVLQIEHKVADYMGWKKAFDSDPINRKGSGVRRHRIFRPADDPNYVIIQLEFDNSKDADAGLTALRKLWMNVEGKIMFDPKTKMLDIAEAIEY